MEEKNTKDDSAPLWENGELIEAPTQMKETNTEENNKEIIVPKSDYTGGAFGFTASGWLVKFVSLITLGLAYPAMRCWRERYIAAHTIIGGRKLTFDGKAGQLFGKYLLWLLLSVITLGIYFILKGALLMRGWIASHTHFADGVTDNEAKSKFDGTWYQLFFVTLLTKLITLVTIGIGSFWAHCHKERWFCKHQQIDGVRLKFNGTGIQYFGKRIVWLLLTLITCGIYAFWLKRNSKRWTVHHTLLIQESEEEIEETSKNLNPEYRRTRQGNLVLAFAIGSLILTLILNISMITAMHYKEHGAQIAMMLVLETIHLSVASIIISVISLKKMNRIEGANTKIVRAALIISCISLGISIEFFMSYFDSSFNVFERLFNILQID